MKIIIYQREDEVIVTSLEQEHEAIRLYFTEGGRRTCNYHRIELKDGYVAIQMSSRLTIDA